MNNYILCFLLLLCTCASAHEISPFHATLTAKQLRDAPAKLIPFPDNVKWGGGFVNITGISSEDLAGLSPTIQRELADLQKQNGLDAKAKNPLAYRFISNRSLAAEAYRLEIKRDAIMIEAATEAGHFYALQTLRQLVQHHGEELRLPICTIEDSPAFPVRGYMIDVGRNFQSIKSLKKQLDIMAHYKLNTFQWHLTDYPAWRVESKKYPQLNAAENHRPTRDPGKFYTYDDIRELIRYAGDRHITIIPEIDMPGHSTAFTDAMGVKMASERGMEILEDVLTEFFAEIPATDCPIIHLGSDEVKIAKPEVFMNRMIDFCKARGREVMVWNPGLPAQPGVIRQTWRVPSEETEKGNFREIDSWNSYINNGEPMTQVQRLFFRPIGFGSKNEVAGGILCLWPDVNLDREEDAFAQNPVYPSMLTYAWRTWTADLQNGYPDYYMALPPRGTAAFDYFAAFETFLIDHRDGYFADEPFPYHTQTDKNWRVIGPFRGDDGDALLADIQDSYAYRGKTLTWTNTTGNTLVIKDRFKLGGYFPEAKAGETAYALTYIHSDRDRKIDARIGFETPMRANRTYTGIPATGQWDASGGNIWLNDTPIPAPKWENPGWKPSNQNGWAPLKEREMPWAAEELYWTRTPTNFALKKGWNKLLVKIPASTNYQNWMFTFIPLNREGLTFATRPVTHSTYYQQRKTHFEGLPDEAGEIILLGDSMTDGCEWDELLGNDKVKNRGISGDVTLGVLDRLDEVTASQPAKVFLLIGTNDLARGYSPKEVISNIGSIVADINRASPQTEVYVQSITPVNDHYGKFGGHTSKGEQIKAINAALKAGINGGYQFVDLYPAFVNDEGKLDITLSNDGLHLNGAGYEVWAEVLRKYLN